MFFFSLVTGVLGGCAACVFLAGPFVRSQRSAIDSIASLSLRRFTTQYFFFPLVLLKKSCESLKVYGVCFPELFCCRAPPIFSHHPFRCRFSGMGRLLIPQCDRLFTIELLFALPSLDPFYPALRIATDSRVSRVNPPR